MAHEFVIEKGLVARAFQFFFDYKYSCAILRVRGRVLKKVNYYYLDVRNISKYQYLPGRLVAPITNTGFVVFSLTTWSSSAKSCDTT